MGNVSVFDSALILFPKVFVSIDKKLLENHLALVKCHIGLDSICPSVHAYRNQVCLLSKKCSKTKDLQVLTFAVYLMFDPFTFDFVTVLIINCSFAMEVAVFEFANILLSTMYVIISKGKFSVTMEQIV